MIECSRTVDRGDRTESAQPCRPADRLPLALQKLKVASYWMLTIIQHDVLRLPGFLGGPLIVVKALLGLGLG